MALNCTLKIAKMAKFNDTHVTTHMCAHIQKDTTKCWWGCGPTKFSYRSSENMKKYQSLWKITYSKVKGTIMPKGAKGSGLV